MDAAFIRYSANSCVLSTVDLRDFLKDQGEDASLVHAQSLILTYELNEWGTVLSSNILYIVPTLIWCVLGNMAVINQLDATCTAPNGIKRILVSSWKMFFLNLKIVWEWRLPYCAQKGQFWKRANLL